MEKKEYLTEEHYENWQKKIRKASLLVLIIGLVIGITLICIGVGKAKKGNEGVNNIVDGISNTVNNVTNQTGRSKEEIQKEMDDLEKKISAINDEKKKLKEEQNQIFQEDMEFSERYYEKQNEIDEKDKEIEKYNNELFDLEKEKMLADTGDVINKSGFDNIFNTAKDTIKEQSSKQKAVPYYVFGGFIIFISLAISAALYMQTKQRELVAYKAQQFRPIVEEGIEKTTPTVAKSAGTIAGSVAENITKGIKDGLKDDKEEK